MLLADAISAGYTPYRTAAAWVFIVCAALALLAFVAAFVFSALPATEHLSRHAMTVAKIFGCLTGVGLLVSIALIMLALF